MRVLGATRFQQEKFCQNELELGEFDGYKKKRKLFTRV